VSRTVLVARLVGLNFAREFAREFLSFSNLVRTLPLREAKPKSLSSIEELRILFDHLLN
jgi:hypothetical protein